MSVNQPLLLYREADVSNDLAKRVLPLQDRLPEIIELGLRQIEASESTVVGYSPIKQRTLDALAATGIAVLPTPAARSRAWTRHAPIAAGGPPASEMIIAERSGECCALTVH